MTEDFQSASPDPAALRKLQSWRSDKASAERFARAYSNHAGEIEGAPASSPFKQAEAAYGRAISSPTCE